jgi:hypothetical protein
MFYRLSAGLLILVTLAMPHAAAAAETAAPEGPRAEAMAAGPVTDVPSGAEWVAEPGVLEAAASCDRQAVFQRGHSGSLGARRLVFQRAVQRQTRPMVRVQYVDGSGDIRYEDPQDEGIQYVGSPAEAACAGGACDVGGGAWDGGACGGRCGPGLHGGLLDSVGVYGWVSQGFTWNPDSPADRFNGPQTFNDRSNEFQMNQLYLVMERPVDPTSCGWDFGGRVDLMYGTDYFFVEASGLETREDGSPRWNSSNGPRGGGASLYGLAMPQLYAEFLVPWGAGLTGKIGHFYSILGYETAMDPVNFFYSRSYMRQYAEPFTETGLLLDYPFAPAWSVQAGVTRGWDNWEDLNDKGSFLGGLQYRCPDGRSSIRLALQTGDEDRVGRNNRTVYSLVYHRVVAPNLVYVFQHDFGTENGAATDANFQPSTAKWYGIAQYLLYNVTPTTALGLRVEWFRDQDNARVLGIPFDSIAQGGNYVELTAGLNWQPYNHVTLRSELRWDWSNVDAPPLGIGGMYDDFQDGDQMTWATNLIVRF